MRAVVVEYEELPHVVKGDEALKPNAPQVGGPRVIAAAPEIMVALGLDLPNEEG